MGRANGVTGPSPPANSYQQPPQSQQPQQQQIPMQENNRTKSPRLVPQQPSSPPFLPMNHQQQQPPPHRQPSPSFQQQQQQQMMMMNAQQAMMQQQQQQQQMARMQIFQQQQQQQQQQQSPQAFPQQQSPPRRTISFTVRVPLAMNGTGIVCISPAIDLMERDGLHAVLKAGDELHTINGLAVFKKPRAVIESMLLGEEGSHVTLGFIRNNQPKLIKVRILRDHVVYPGDSALFGAAVVRTSRDVFRPAQQQQQQPQPQQPQQQQQQRMMASPPMMRPRGVHSFHNVSEVAEVAAMMGGGNIRRDISPRMQRPQMQQVFFQQQLPQQQQQQQQQQQHLFQQQHQQKPLSRSMSDFDPTKAMPGFDPYDLSKSIAPLGYTVDIGGAGGGVAMLEKNRPRHQSPFQHHHQQQQQSPVMQKQQPNGEMRFGIGIVLHETPGCLRVRSILAGSVAESADIQVGDALLEIDNVDFEAKDRRRSGVAHQHLSGPAGSQVYLKLWREGARTPHFVTLTRGPPQDHFRQQQQQQQQQQQAASPNQQSMKQPITMSSPTRQQQQQPRKLFPPQSQQQTNNNNNNNNNRGSRPVTPPPVVDYSNNNTRVGQQQQQQLRQHHSPSPQVQRRAVHSQSPPRQRDAEYEREEAVQNYQQMEMFRLQQQQQQQQQQQAAPSPPHHAQTGGGYIIGRPVSSNQQHQAPSLAIAGSLATEEERPSLFGRLGTPPMVRAQRKPATSQSDMMEVSKRFDFSNEAHDGAGPSIGVMEMQRTPEAVRSARWAVNGNRNDKNLGRSGDHGALYDERENRPMRSPQQQQHQQQQYPQQPARKIFGSPSNGGKRNGPYSNAGSMNATMDNATNLAPQAGYSSPPSQTIRAVLSTRSLTPRNLLSPSQVINTDTTVVVPPPAQNQQGYYGGHERSNNNNNNNNIPSRNAGFAPRPSSARSSTSPPQAIRRVGLGRSVDSPLTNPQPYRGRQEFSDFDDNVIISNNNNNMDNPSNNQRMVGLSSGVIGVSLDDAFNTAGGRRSIARSLSPARNPASSSNTRINHIEDTQTFSPQLRGRNGAGRSVSAERQRSPRVSARNWDQENYAPPPSMNNNNNNINNNSNNNFGVSNQYGPMKMFGVGLIVKDGTSGTIIVHQVLPDSAAARSGLVAAGDALVSIDDRPLSHYFSDVNRVRGGSFAMSIQQKLNSMERGRIEITKMRSGAKLNVYLAPMADGSNNDAENQNPNRPMSSIVVPQKIFSPLPHVHLPRTQEVVTDEFHLSKDAEKEMPRDRSWILV